MRGTRVANLNRTRCQIANGIRFTTTDASLHTWTAVNKSEGFPGGGNGGQWFVKRPPTVDGRPAPTGAPSHVVNVRNGNQYVMGNYSAEAETFSYSVDGNATACSCCPFPPTCLVEPSASNPQGSSAIPRTDASNQFGWGAMQFAGERLMNVAWITNIVSPENTRTSSIGVLSLPDGGAYSAAGAWR